MRGKTHIGQGIVAWEGLLVAGLASGDNLLLGVAATFCAAWGALGPDMDHPMATWAHSIPGGQRWARFVAKRFGGHRQGTHSIYSIGIAFTSMVVLIWSGWLIQTIIQSRVYGQTVEFHPEYIIVNAQAFATGWTAHILGDMMTVQGVGIFYPYTKKRFRIANLRTSPTKKLNTGEAVLVFVTYCTGAVFTINLLGGFA
jgi:membrane-bound metal-dependent hydrolase YbcI (DUF457 family)